MSAENLSQVLDFLVHAVEHLANGVDFHFAAFEALQCETDRQVFGQLHDHRLVRLCVRRLRRQAGERLFQRVLRAARQLRHLLLKRTRRGHSTLPRADVPETRQRTQNCVNLFLTRLAAPASATSGSTSTAKRPRDAPGSRQARHHIGYLHASTATAGPEAPNRSRHVAGSTSANTHCPAEAACAVAIARSNTRACAATGA